MINNTKEKKASFTFSWLIGIENFILSQSAVVRKRIKL